jgi:hypothetical protein
MTACIRSIVACLGALVVAAPARADGSFPSYFEEVPAPPQDPFSYAWSDPRMASVIGIGVTVGGGIVGFADGEMRDVISNPVAFAWNVRVAIGTHIPLGVEINYAGSAARVITLADEDNGYLVGTTLEGMLRWTVLPHASGTPYVFAGAGWQHYGVEDADFPLADSGIRSSDNAASFPGGVGMAYRDDAGWVGDVRGTFRFTTGSSLLLGPNGENATMDSWELTAAFGYEF